MPDLNTNKKDDLNVELEEIQQQEQATQPQGGTNSDDIPDPRFKGKSAKEVVESYLNLEKLQQRQASELGQYRTRVDEILGLREKKDNPKPKERNPVTVAELLESPDKVLQNAIGNSDVAETVQTALSRVDNIERDLAKDRFLSKHTSFEADMKDPEFLNWVGSNNLRRNLAARADQMDWSAATDLWDLWAEHKEVIGTKAKQVQDTKKKEVLKAVSSVPNGSSAERPNKPVLSRAKLMDLQIRAERGDAAAKAKWEDPEFQRMRLEAYQDGRVK